MLHHSAAMNRYAGPTVRFGSDAAVDAAAAAPYLEHVTHT
eukprot:gene15270-23916_t